MCVGCLQVVQVYTYMLSPLIVRPAVEPGQSAAAPPTGQQQQQPDGAASEQQSGGVFGYQLRIVMELCSQVRPGQIFVTAG